MLTLDLPFDLLAMASLELSTQSIPTLRTTRNMGIKEQAERTGRKAITLSLLLQGAIKQDFSRTSRTPFVGKSKSLLLRFRRIPQ